MIQKDICDIIIENAIKDWKNSMISKDQREIWEIPKYSKLEINKAGSIIADPSSSKEERDNALIILNNWRASHAYPLQVICSNLRLRNPDAIVVQRLKRLESISGKIERFPDMSLYRMQDLGGCRVIADTIEQVYEAVDRYKNSRIRHILKREYDYIQNPKDSGYRSYHMVYRFHSDKKDTYNKNMLIEIQFRTKLQHIWATAVEMMGIYTKSQLKASMGDKDILRFFVLVSSVFAKMENMPICPDTNDNYNILISEIKQIDSTQYTSGETGNSTMTLGSAQHMLKMQCNDDTILLDSPMRFAIDKNIKKPTCYKVTQNDNSAYNYGKGLCCITVTETPLNTESDKLVTLDDGTQVWICNYNNSHTPLPHTPSEPNETTDLRCVISGNTNLKNGYRRTYTVSFKHCIHVYEKYEKILEENGLENGEVEISMELINDAYKQKLKEGF